MYAETKKIALEDVEVKLSHKRIYADDCKDCEKKVGMLDRIECQISLNGNLDQEERQRLMKIAGRCPVHRTLSGEVQIQTTEI